MELRDFKPGQRVQLHPATDLWMRGDKFGTVSSVGRKFVRVRMDKSGDLVSVAPGHILEILETPAN